MTLNSISTLAITTILVLASVPAEARTGDYDRGDSRRGEDRRDDRRDRREDYRHGDRRDNDRHGGGHHGGPGYPRPRPPGHGGPGHPMPPPHYPNPPRPPSYPPGHGQVIVVQLPINLRMYNSTRVDLIRFIDMNHFRGMRVVAVEVNARSVFGNSVLDLLVNGYFAQSVGVSQYNQIYSLFVNGLVLGYGGQSLVLANRGDVDVYGVTLKLVR